MISIKKCSKILNTNSKKYAEEEIKKIRDFLYILAALEYQLNKKVKVK
jgi:hypothetical protein